MRDLIDRQAAIDAECKVCQIAPEKERGHNCTYYVHGCKEIECLRELPSAERKKGEWLEHYSHEDGEKDGVECSKCRTHYYFGGQFMNFCPNCGAEMRGEEE